MSRKSNLSRTTETREEEMQARQRRKLERWHKSLPRDRREALEKECVGDTPTNRKLLAEGLIEPCSDSKTGYILTPVGELRLHQLELIEWMVKDKAKKEIEERNMLLTPLTEDEEKTGGE
jgi:hypothetical protein